MKIKFVLLVVLGFAMGSYADCSKDEILKLLDKGYSKSEVDGICGESEKKKALKWITPSKSVCVGNGGKIVDGSCEAKWSDAKKTCNVSGGKLATKSEFIKVIIDCGGKINTNNLSNSFYYSCFKNKGFISNHYWSSSPSSVNHEHALTVNLENANWTHANKALNRYVRCINID
ncbi:MAG: Unknown protein [uncultured Sulfurovum sp.]|uniref:DUF1566 domain-containing protein n=1 Tax=uncultured Sulfurovum sp. TaxID=269237 RepID=A0A6S6SH43_9BACT|nr:MAG: Unknown protein [uncultured Sulfurovum sp.]